MSVKKILYAIFIFFCTTKCFGQDTVEKTNRLTDKVVEKFHVLKDNQQIKNGPYQAFYKRKTPIAIGHYTKGKKTGLWYFYNINSALLQVYNYDKDSLRYEAREDTTSNFRYLIDKELSYTDKVTKPIKAGGRYYGYLPYLGLYQTPFDPYYYGTSDCAAIIELLISPMGRLADYKVRVVSGDLEFDQTVTMDIRLFKEEDKKFIPATYNGQPVLSRIIIRCLVTKGGGLDFFR
jgi:hypothetical protein